MVIHVPCWYTEGRRTKGYNSYHMLHIIQQGDTPLITPGILFTHSNKKIINE